MGIYDEPGRRGAANLAEPDAEYLEVQVEAVDYASGSVWVLSGVLPDGRPVTFGAEARSAAAIAEALEAGEAPTVYVERWQLL